MRKDAKTDRPGADGPTRWADLEKVRGPMFHPGLFLALMCPGSLKGFLLFPITKELS